MIKKKNRKFLLRYISVDYESGGAVTTPVIGLAADYTFGNSNRH